MNATTDTENPAALQLKIQHYADMSLFVLEGIFRIPKGFTVVTIPEGLIVNFVKDIDGDGEPVIEEREYTADPSRLVNIYGFLWDCIEEARVCYREYFDKADASTMKHYFSKS